MQKLIDIVAKIDWEKLSQALNQESSWESYEDALFAQDWAQNQDVELAHQERFFD